tara:strand:+ start:470 stop:598 length:129 start_codon:yes stop_codon:yes gene_type:complete
MATALAFANLKTILTLIIIKKQDKSLVIILKNSKMVKIIEKE